MIIIPPNLRLDYETSLCAWAEGGSCARVVTHRPKWITPQGEIVPLRWYGGDNPEARHARELRFCDEHATAFMAYIGAFSRELIA